jgi:hypothetical protein
MKKIINAVIKKLIREERVLMIVEDSGNPAKGYFGYILILLIRDDCKPLIFYYYRAVSIFIFRVESFFRKVSFWNDKIVCYK